MNDQFESTPPPELSLKDRLNQTFNSLSQTIHEQSLHYFFYPLKQQFQKLGVSATEIFASWSDKPYTQNILDTIKHPDQAIVFQAQDTLSQIRQLPELKKSIQKKRKGERPDDKTLNGFMCLVESFAGEALISNPQEGEEGKKITFDSWIRLALSLHGVSILTQELPTKLKQDRAIKITAHVAEQITYNILCQLAQDKPNLNQYINSLPVPTLNTASTRVGSLRQTPATA